MGESHGLSRLGSDWCSIARAVRDRVKWLARRGSRHDFMTMHVRHNFAICDGRTRHRKAFLPETGGHVAQVIGSRGGTTVPTVHVPLYFASVTYLRRRASGDNGTKGTGTECAVFSDRWSPTGTCQGPLGRPRRLAE